MERRGQNIERRSFARTLGQPEEGYYRMKMVSGGPWVAARIWFGPPADPVTGELLDRSWRWQALVNGKEADPFEVWTWVKDPIPEREYQYLIDSYLWAQANAPNSPEANPRQKINRLTTDIPEF